MKSFLSIAAAMIMTAAVSIPLAAQENGSSGKKPVIILKLDDFTCKRPGRKPVFPSVWLSTHEFLTERNIKYGIGVHCEMFEENHPQTIDWMKEQQEKGRVEFWCHGYKAAREKLPDGSLEPGEFERGYEEQKATLTKCRDLSKEKLGKAFQSFGPHWSGTTEATSRAMKEIPEFTTWMYASVEQGKASGKYPYPRYLALEYKTFIPNLEEFKKQWNRSGKMQDAVVLQGHPKSWMWEKDRPRFEEFKKIIEFLIAEGCTFSTPSEYYETQVLKK